MFITDGEQGLINMDSIKRIYREDDIKFDGVEDVLHIQLKVETIDGEKYCLFACPIFNLYKRVINYILSEIKNNSSLIDLHSFIHNVYNEKDDSINE